MCFQKNRVFTKDRLQDNNFCQVESKVNDVFKRDENITTKYTAIAKEEDIYICLLKGEKPKKSLKSFTETSYNLLN